MASGVRLKVLYVGLRFDYGEPRRGKSFEFENLYGSLKTMDYLEISFFPFDQVLRERGREQMNRLLLEEVRRVQPQLVFFVLFTDEIERSTIEQISKQTITVNWFADDHWRFESFSRHWAPLFHWVTTTYSGAIEKYHALGFQNVIKTQWACNTHVYYPRDVPRDLDVTFVGRKHSNRAQVLRLLRRKGLSVRAWGRGWPGGRLSQEEMIRTFCRSSINLNFTESSVSFGLKRYAKLFLTRRADGTLRLNTLKEFEGMASVLFQPPPPQIKARNFEIPGCGGFLLTSDADDLSSYYKPGQEIVVFENAADLIEKVQYYLAHDEEREAIRQGGYERTIRDHSYEKRFLDIFRTMGFQL